jgi:putative nucleotidyltransferase with HDIG domain
VIEAGSQTDAADAIGIADAALYAAKTQGKGRVALHAPTRDQARDLRSIAQGDRGDRLRAAASLAHAVDARDAYTAAHSEAVATIATQIARRFDLDDETVELVRLAGILHDLGKLAIPEDILRKGAPLTPAERLILQKHPSIGFRMLESLGVEPVATWILHHHEHWDGGGYPSGLAGEEIPLAARILVVADSFDAMTSDRSYRAGLSMEDAVLELHRCAGTQFDPRVVDALLRELPALRSASLTAV